jgi:hypothetical protein
MLKKRFIRSRTIIKPNVREMICLIAKNFEAWEVKESDFPLEGTAAEQLKFLLRYAILAPSGPNTQPWKFAIKDRTISVFADLKRGLPFVDPSNRTLYMSVGCAITNLVIAGEHFGFSCTTEYFPKSQDDELVADVVLEKGKGPASLDLFPEITRRCTIKHKYGDRRIDYQILADLKTCISDQRFNLDYMTDKEKKSELADLVARAHRIQLGNKNFRRNLGDWLRHNWTTEADGMPLYTFGVPDAISLGFPAAFREFDLSDAVIYRDKGLVNGSSAMAVLSSEMDDKPAWVKSGIMLERLMLKATRYDVRLSFFSQPIGIPELREELRVMTGNGYPLLLFSLGYAQPVKHTPRRRLQDVLIVS